MYRFHSYFGIFLFLLPIQGISQSSIDQQASVLYDSILSTRNPQLVKDMISDFPSEQIQSDSLRSYVIYYYGSALGQLGQFDSSLYYLRRSREIIEGQDYPIIRIQILRALGNVYWSQSYFNLALENYQNALRISNSINMAEFQVSLMGNIAGIYAKLGDYEEALDYAFLAEQVSKETGIERPRSHMKIGLYHLDLNRYKKGIFHLKETIRRIRINNRDSIALGVCYLNIGSGFLKLEQLDSADIYFEKARKTLQAVGYTEISLFVDQGYLALTRDDFQSTKENLRLALNAAQKRGDIAKLIEAYELQRDYATAINDYQQALESQKTITGLTDSMRASEMVNRVYELETQYETAEKDYQLQLANTEINQQQRNQLILGFMALFLVIIAVVLYRSYRLKNQSNRILDARNQALSDLDATKNKLFAILSHDLKNPVSAFRSMTNALAENYEQLSHAKAKGYLEKMSRNAVAVENQLNDLLLWASQQIKKEQVITASINIENLTEEVFDLVRPMADQKDIKLEKEIDRSFSLISHPEMLKTVLRNLVTNAVKFTEQSGIVRLEAQMINGFPSISIKDTGIGMSPEEIRLLFDLGRSSEIGSHKAKGTGIGLSICKDIIEKLDGTIDVDSRRNEGTVFSLQFVNEHG